MAAASTYSSVDFCSAYNLIIITRVAQLQSADLHMHAQCTPFSYADRFLLLLKAFAECSLLPGEKIHKFPVLGRPQRTGRTVARINFTFSAGETGGVGQLKGNRFFRNVSNTSDR
jgi:hypothetical protein